MASYIKAPLGPDGIVVMRGKLEKVEGRASATEVVHGDTDILLEKAREAWPELENRVVELHTRTMRWQRPKFPGWVPRKR